MEPALMPAIAKVENANNPDAAANQAQFMMSFMKVREIYETGDRRAALEAFLNSRAGDLVRGVLDFLVKSGEFDQAVRDADTFIEVEIPGAVSWTFTPDDAAKIKIPILSVLGAHSPERAQKVDAVLKRWAPQTETTVLPNADHALPLMDPSGMAAVVAEFIARYPIHA
jgi:3-oxoadipate enol-lactonase